MAHCYALHLHVSQYSLTFICTDNKKKVVDREEGPKPFRASQRLQPLAVTYTLRGLGEKFI